MTTIQWRPEVNALTTPQSFRPRHVPRAVYGYDELAALIATANPVYNQGLGKGFMLTMREQIKKILLGGNQLTLEGLFTAHISFSGRMDAPDDPLPPLEESLHVKIYASKILVDEVRQEGQIERLQSAEKLPVISSAGDTVLELDDVLNPHGLLRLTGSDLAFDRRSAGLGCVLEGTRSGRKVQSRYGSIANTEVLLMPDIPAQPNPWNNEYRVTVTAQYTENGSPRTGTYRRLLRVPLTVTLGSNDGILSGSSNTPLAIISGGSLDGASTQVRIQALFDARDSLLRLNLLDMEEHGKEGDAVTVSGNGPVTLPGFTGSPLTALEVTVNRHDALADLVKTGYPSRMVDVLNVNAGS